MELGFYPGLIVGAVGAYPRALKATHQLGSDENPQDGGLLGTTSVPFPFLQVRIPFLMDHMSIRTHIPHVLRDTEKSRTIHIRHIRCSNVIKVYGNSGGFLLFFVFLSFLILT